MWNLIKDLKWKSNKKRKTKNNNKNKYGNVEIITQSETGVNEYAMKTMTHTQIYFLKILETLIYDKY